jgi:F-type H+-transporting ATPase subunit a
LEFHIAAPTLFTIFGLPVTNTVFTAWVVSLVVILLVRAATSNLSLVPGRLQSVFELLLEQFLSIGEQVADSRRARQFLPIGVTLFLFITISNWMGILPLFGEGHLYVDRDDGQGHLIHANILRSANSDLNVTLAMGLIVFLWSEFLGFKIGGLAYAKEFIWPGLLIEVISHLARPVALALRLFGNILAGEILLTVMAGLVPIVVPALFMGFELFVGIVQALIFALLTLAFLAMATTAHGAEHHGEATVEAGATHH